MSFNGSALSRPMLRRDPLSFNVRLSSLMEEEGRQYHFILKASSLFDLKLSEVGRDPGKSAQPSALSATASQAEKLLQSSPTGAGPGISLGSSFARSILGFGHH